MTIVASRGSAVKQEDGLRTTRYRSRHNCRLLKRLRRHLRFRSGREGGLNANLH